MTTQQSRSQEAPSAANLDLARLEQALKAFAGTGATLAIDGADRLVVVLEGGERLTFPGTEALTELVGPRLEAFVEELRAAQVDLGRLLRAYERRLDDPGAWAVHRSGLDRQPAEAGPREGSPAPAPPFGQAQDERSLSTPYSPGRIGRGLDHLPPQPGEEPLFRAGDGRIQAGGLIYPELEGSELSSRLYSAEVLALAGVGEAFNHLQPQANEASRFAIEARERRDRAGPHGADETRPPEPRAADDLFRLREDGVLTGSLFENDFVPGAARDLRLRGDPPPGSLTLNEDGTFTYAPPPDLSGRVQFTYSFTDARTGRTVEAVATVVVEPVADPARLLVPAAPVVTREDRAVALGLGGALTDLDGSETALFRLRGVPEGASFGGAGRDLGGGVWEFTTAELTTSLTFVPPLHQHGVFQLVLEGVTRESANGDTATVQHPFSIEVIAAADAPTVRDAVARGDENTAIPFGPRLAYGLVDADGSERITSVEISAFPPGWTVAYGAVPGVTIAPDGAGGWTISGPSTASIRAAIETLQVTPPLNSDADASVTYTVTTKDADGSTARSTARLDVVVDPVAEGATIAVQPRAVEEDAWVNVGSAVTLGRIDQDGSESITLIEVAGWGTAAARWTAIGGASVTAIADGFAITGGTEADRLATLATFEARQAPHSDADIALTVRAQTTDHGGVLSPVATATFAVAVDAEADAPVVTVAPVSGQEDAAIPFGGAALWTKPDGDGSEWVSAFEIGAFPAGWMVAFTADPRVVVTGSANGPYLLTIASPAHEGALRAVLDSFSVTPPAHADADATVSVRARTTDADGSAAWSPPAPLAVNVRAAADGAALGGAGAGSEDTDIPVPVALALVDQDGSEGVVWVEVTGVPAGGALTWNTGLPGTVTAPAPGTTRFAGTLAEIQQLLASLAVRPPPDSDGEFDLTVTALVRETQPTEAGDVAVLDRTTVLTLPVAVTAIADTPNVAGSTHTTPEDTRVVFGPGISFSVNDTDGSEAITTIALAGFPAGAAVDWNTGLPGAVTNPAAGIYEISGTPGEIRALLDSFAVTPALHDAADFAIGVAATVTDHDGSTATQTTSHLIVVTPVPDAPNAAVGAGAFATSEDMPVLLAGLAGSLVDGDGSEALTFRITGSPGHAVAFTTGNQVSPGVWAFTPAQILAGVTYDPPSNFAGTVAFTLTAIATETETAVTASTALPFTVTVGAVADAPLVPAGGTAGDEDTVLAFGAGVTYALTDTDGSEVIARVAIGTIPAGSTIGYAVSGAAAVSVDAAGRYVITGPEADIRATLDSFTLTPPAHRDQNIALSIAVTSREVGGAEATTTGTHVLTVAAAADPPIVAGGPASGAEDAAIPVPVTVTLVDADGSETLQFVEVTGVPAGGALGYNNGLPGTVTPIAGGLRFEGTTAQIQALLATLTVQAPLHADADITLAVLARSREVNPSEAGEVSVLTADRTFTVPVTVLAVADAPSVTVSAVSGSEDTAITFGTATAWTKPDNDGSEWVSAFEIAAFPAGWSVQFTGDPAVTVSGGANGPFTLSIAAQGDEAKLRAVLDSFRVTPPLHSDADATVTARARTTDNDGSTAWGANAPLTVAVNPVSDTPVLSNAGPLSVEEDTAITFGTAIAWTKPDNDGSERISRVELSGLPSAAGSAVTYTATGGATVTNPSAGTYVITAATEAAIRATLDTFALRQATNRDADITVTARARTVDGTAAASADAVTTLSIVVDAQADAPSVAAANVSGNEDTAITFGAAIAWTKPDNDGSEWVSSVEIGAFPAGWAVAFTSNANVAVTGSASGPYTLSIGAPAHEAALRAVLDSFQVTPPAHADADASVAVRAQTTDADGSAAWGATSPIGVTVRAVADAPSATAGNAAGPEDTWIPVTLGTAASADTDGSETLSLRVTGVPSGALFSAGTNLGGGVWSFTQADLAGLTFRPPAQASGTISMVLEATSTEAASGAQVAVKTAVAQAPFSVTVSAVLDNPNLSNTSQTVNEDSTVNVGPQLGIGLVDLDGSQSFDAVISGIPSGFTVGRTLTGATSYADLGGGSVRFWGANAADVITSIRSMSLAVGAGRTHQDANFTLTVSATTVEAGGASATESATHSVTVRAMADAPAHAASNPTVNEDPASPIPFPVTVTLVDADGSETLQRVDVVFTSFAGSAPGLGYALSGAATATALANGFRFTGPTADIQATLATITVTPVTHNGSDIGLRVISVAQESNPTEAGDVGTATATTTTNYTINMVPVADQPTVSSPGLAAPYTGEEDARIKLSGALVAGMPGALGGGLVDTDGSEALTFRITGAPAGAAFYDAASGGSAVGSFAGGAWTFTAAQVNAGIFFRPPPNASGTYDMTWVSVATETENGNQSTNAAPFRVVVDPEADLPTVSGATIGDEDTAIAFGANVAASPSDADGSEWVSSVTLSAFPAGWAVSFTPDADVTVTGSGEGPYTLTITAQAHAAALRTVLDSFTVTPPAQSDANATITVSATSTDADGSTATRAGVAHTVTVRAVADAPVANAAASSGDEDTDIDTALSLGIGADADGSETLSARVLGVPAGWTLLASTAGGGTVTDVGGGVYAITAPTTAQLDAIVQSVQLRAPQHLSGSVTLQLEVTATEAASGAELAQKTAVTTSAFTVTAVSVADAPALSVAHATGAAAGFEDTFIPLSIRGELVDLDGSESLSVTISGVPAGAVFGDRSNTPVGVDLGGGVWSFTVGELSGLKIKPPPNSNLDFQLGVTVRATEDGPPGNPGIGSVAETTATLNVQVIGVADVPTLSVGTVTGTEDQPIPLGASIAAALTDLDGSEVLYYVISGLPAGVVPSAGVYIGGEWQVAAADIAALTIAAPPNFSGSYTATFAPGLTVRAVAQEDDGNQRSVSAPLTVTVAPVMDAFAGWHPSVQVAEDTDIPLAAVAFSGLSDADGSESIVAYTFDLNGIIAAAQIGQVVANPAQFIAGYVTGTFTDNGDGTITVLPADLAGIALRKGAFADSNVDFTIPVSALVTESGGLQQSVGGTVSVDLVGDADAPIAFANDVSAITGQLTPINPTGSEFGGALADTDAALGRPGSERIYYIVSGPGTTVGTDLAFFKPDGTLAGLNNNDGTWYLSPDDLVGLSIASRYGVVGSVQLTLTAVSVEDDGDLATGAVPATFTVTFQADPGGSGGNTAPLPPVVSVVPMSTAEDGGVVFTVTASPAPGDPSPTPPTITLLIWNLPPGATIEGAVLNPTTGRWMASAADLAAGLVTIHPPPNYSGTMPVSVEAVAINSQLYTASTGAQTVNVAVAPAVDGPTISASPAVGHEDTGTLLHLTVGSPDGLDRTPGTAGDDTPEEITGLIRVTVDSGASLSAGTLVSAGVYDLTPAELAGLRLQPSPHWHGTVNLTVTATAREPDSNATRTSTHGFSVVVAPAADAPSATAGNATGAEDGVITFNGLSAALVDADGSERLSVKILGIPPDSILSAGANNGDGSWTIPAAALSTLTIRPPKDYSGTMNLMLEAYALEADGSTATTSIPFTVTVAPVADAPILDTDTIVLPEDGIAALRLGLRMADLNGTLPGENAPELVELTLWGLSAGAQIVAGAGGSLTQLSATSWQFTGTAAQAAGLAYQGAPDGHGFDTVSVTAIAIDGASRSAPVSGYFWAFVTAVADAPTLFTADAAGVAGTSVPLNIASSLVDADGSETLSVKLLGVPAGVTLSAGTLNAGEWTLTPADLNGLSMTLPAGQASFSVTVQAISQESSQGGSTATTSGLIAVDVGAVGAAINGDGADNHLRGGGNADTIAGGAGADTILGGDGDDHILGGAGIDLLSGGTGADTFAWQGGDTAAADTITDFSTAEGDTLDLSAILTGYGGGPLAGFVQLVESGGNTTLSVDPLGSGSFTTSIAILQGVTGLNAEAMRANGHLIV